MKSGADAVLQFWFGERPDDPLAVQAQSERWWRKDPDFDAEIRTRFGALRDAAVAGTLDGWLADARERLALIILVDQFSRNLFRNSPEAFAQDALARHWCIDGLARGHDGVLLPIERQFFYLPLEHSESLNDQQRCVALFTTLRDEAGPAWRKMLDGALDFAQQHLAIIERFGRFPHRNVVLGRMSTPDERDFLMQPGSSF